MKNVREMRHCGCVRPHDDDDDDDGDEGDFPTVLVWRDGKTYS